MPKLSNARRYRRQNNLSGYCVNQTPRKVSEDSIVQEQSSCASPDAASKECCETSEEIRPLLKRREPSTCLSDLCFLSPLPKVPSTNENVPSCSSQEGENDDSRTISPVWGHFVDVVLDDENQQSPTPSLFGDDLPTWPGASTTTTMGRAHSPYGKSARKRLRVRSPARDNKGETTSLSGFILQDPATLHDALSRLSV